MDPPTATQLVLGSSICYLFFCSPPLLHLPTPSIPAALAHFSPECVVLGGRTVIHQTSQELVVCLSSNSRQLCRGPSLCLNFQPVIGFWADLLSLTKSIALQICRIPCSLAIKLSFPSILLQIILKGLYWDKSICLKEKI